MLGSAVICELRARGLPVVAWLRENADLAHPETIAPAYALAAPRAVIHCAAWTQVDSAEDHPELCRIVNVDSSAVLAGCAARDDAAFVYVSSCGIFDGAKPAPYDERDAPAPRTAHHRSKYEGELAVRAQHPRPLIVRPGWLFGGAAAQKKNFVAARLREAHGQKSIFSSAEQYGSPTWSDDAARRIVALLLAGRCGLCHVINEGMVSRFEYVEAILRLAGSTTRVERAAPGAFARKAAVSRNEALTSVQAAAWNLPLLQPWHAALAEYLRSTAA